MDKFSPFYYLKKGQKSGIGFIAYEQVVNIEVLKVR